MTSRDVEKQRRKLEKELKARQKEMERRKIKDEKKRVKEAEKAEKEKLLADKKKDKAKLKANSIQVTDILGVWEPFFGCGTQNKSGRTAVNCDRFGIRRMRAPSKMNRSLDGSSYPS